VPLAKETAVPTSPGNLFVVTTTFNESMDFFANVLGWEIVDAWGDQQFPPRGAIVVGYGGTSVMVLEKTEPLRETWTDLVCAGGF
jgi:hypothetical protein